jgi:hypothetical protein
MLETAYVTFSSIDVGEKVRDKNTSLLLTALVTPTSVAHIKSYTLVNIDSLEYDGTSLETSPDFFALSWDNGICFLKVVACTKTPNSTPKQNGMQMAESFEDKLCLSFEYSVQHKHSNIDTFNVSFAFLTKSSSNALVQEIGVGIFSAPLRSEVNDCGPHFEPSKPYYLSVKSRRRK